MLYLPKAIISTIITCVLIIALVVFGSDNGRAERTQEVCIDALMVTGDHQTIKLNKAPYAGLGIGASRGSYYLDSWVWGSVAFIPVRMQVILKWGVVDFTGVNCP